MLDYRKLFDVGEKITLSPDFYNHIYANNIENKLEFPLLSLIVSGGHTELLYVSKPYLLSLVALFLSILL